MSAPMTLAMELVVFQAQPAQASAPAEGAVREALDAGLPAASGDWRAA